MTEIQHTIGSVSRESGVHIETIRYYERIGLIPRQQRSNSGRRIYDPQDRQRLSFIRRCRELGFSLDDIRSLLDLAGSNDRTCQEVKDLTEAHLASVRSRLSDLKRMEASLKALSQSCEGGGSPDCPILARLFV